MNIVTPSLNIMILLPYKNWLVSYNYCTDSVAYKAHGSQPCMVTKLLQGGQAPPL